MTTDDQLLGPGDAARHIGVTVDRLGHLVAAGRGPAPVVVAGRRFYQRAELDRWDREDRRPTGRPRKASSTVLIDPDGIEHDAWQVAWSGERDPSGVRVELDERPVSWVDAEVTVAGRRRIVHQVVAIANLPRTYILRVGPERPPPTGRPRREAS